MSWDKVKEANTDPWLAQDTATHRIQWGCNVKGKPIDESSVREAAQSFRALEELTGRQLQ